LGIQGGCSFLAAAALFAFVDGKEMRIETKKREPVGVVTSASMGESSASGAMGESSAVSSATEAGENKTDHGADPMRLAPEGERIQRKTQQIEIQAQGPASSPALAEWSGNEEVPHNTLTTDTSDNCSATDGAQHHEQLSLFESISLLLCNYNYAIPVLNLSVVFLVAQGVQFWAPEYLLLVFSPVSETTITVTTLLVLLTGPATGILAGGKLVDHFGGYHGLNQRITTYKILLTMGSVSVFAGFGANVLSGEPEYGKACFLLWVVLAVGAGSVGPLQGISISAIPVKSLRTFGNSLATVAFMVGASIGPLLPGFGLEEFCREGVVSVVCAQEAVAPLLTLGCAFVVGNTALCLWWETRRVRGVIAVGGTVETQRIS